MDGINEASTKKLINSIWKDMLDEVSNENYSFRLINSEIPISKYINIFADNLDVKLVNIASGFVYKCGLKAISEVFEKIKNSNGSINIIVGSLKEYFHASTDNKLVNIDLETAKSLNALITENNCDIYTFEEKFYHGKFYLIEGEELAYCIVGSSNLTSSGFIGNYELNTMHLMKRDSKQYHNFRIWFDEFKARCSKINILAECNFSDTNMKFDTINTQSGIVSVAVSDIRNEVQSLSDDEVKFRLNLWLSKSPTNIYRRLDIENLKDYVAFEFKENKLVVFESFEVANGYYYFHGDNIFEIIEKVKALTKTQIFNYLNMEKRGYHARKSETLEKNILSLFNM